MPILRYPSTRVVSSAQDQFLDVLDWFSSLCAKDYLVDLRGGCRVTGIPTAATGTGEYWRDIAMDQLMSHAFISYVQEDKDQVERLCEELRSHGFEVWLDREQLLPGERWRSAIRRAIREGAFFVACFSEAYASRNRTHIMRKLPSPSKSCGKGHPTAPGLFLSYFRIVKYRIVK
jgi:hypothetical protein